MYELKTRNGKYEQNDHNRDKQGQNIEHSETKELQCGSKLGQATWTK